MFNLKANKKLAEIYDRILSVNESRHTEFFRSSFRTKGVIVHPSMERPISLLPFFLVALKTYTIGPKKTCTTRLGVLDRF